MLPLSKKLGEQAGKVYERLADLFPVDYDDAGSIGKRYRRQDEIGTPFCITYDFESAEDGCVTVRDRDTMQQERIAIRCVSETGSLPADRPIGYQLPLTDTPPMVSSGVASYPSAARSMSHICR